MIRFGALDIPNPELTHHTACDIPDCGQVRCDVDEGGCGERMTCMGPEPRPCGLVCVDCPHAHCGPCGEAALDREDERRYEIARDARHG